MLFIFYPFQWKNRFNWFNETKIENYKNYYYTNTNVNFHDVNKTIIVGLDVYMIWQDDRKIYEKFS